MQFITKIKYLILPILLAISLGVLAEIPSHDHPINHWDQKIDYTNSYEARHHAEELHGIIDALMNTFGIVFIVVILFYMFRAAWRGTFRFIKRLIIGYDDE